MAPRKDKGVSTAGIFGGKTIGHKGGNAFAAPCT